MSVDLVRLFGAPWERGRHFGLLRRPQIHSYMRGWLECLHAARIDKPEAYITAMVDETEFTSAIETHTPDILEEVRGIACGAGMPFKLVLGAQFMDEEWFYRSRYTAGTALAEKCSSIAIALNGGPTWIGQNMDIGGYTDGHQLAMEIGPHADCAGALIFTIGCMIALMGVNAYGVAVCVNSLPQLPVANHGLPVSFVIRKLLQARSAAEAASTIRDVPHASGQHYLVADASEIRSFEACSAEIVEYESPNPLRVMHTNHPLTNIGIRPDVIQDLTNTMARLESLKKCLMQGTPYLEVIKAALSATNDPDHPVCIERDLGKLNVVTGLRTFTTGSMISVLSEGVCPVEVWMSAGPPSVRGYERLELNCQ